MAKDGAKRAKYSKEVEEIKRLRDLGKILKMGDMENALLSNSAKDTETINDNVLDSLLDSTDKAEHGTEKGLEVIERLTTSGPTGKVVKNRTVKVQRAGKKVKVSRSYHIVKKPKSSRKR